MTTANLTKVIVPCRLSYAHLWEPDSINGSEPKYSVSCIIDKNDKETIAKIKKAIEVAKDEGKGKWGGKIPANLKTPLRDGDIDRPEDEAYADSMFLNANSKQAPQIVDRQVQPILDQSEVYPAATEGYPLHFMLTTATATRALLPDLEMYRS